MFTAGCVVSTGQEDRAVGRPGEEEWLRLAARGPRHACSASRAHREGGEDRWADGHGHCSTGWAQLRCHLEDGLLDPEGGQQNWCRTLSSLPRKGRGGKKEKRQRKRITGNSIRKIQLEMCLLLFSNPQILWVVCKHHPNNPFPSQRQDPPQREQPNKPRPTLMT